jgi:hypothetical protein
MKDRRFFADIVQSPEPGTWVLFGSALLTVIAWKMLGKTAVHASMLLFVGAALFLSLV